ncbi:hypothetical protein SPHINGO391_470340 [Sphingomonas aurantiaca]|uniref:Uncharacterized protein n=1 Tax=Sphingomonas aurantiaca TaxID=185949 RepID=A0A5E7ZYU3_9SPHN|nr:hypothetical protein SPHINGO391_470340 [Sphingomonas aurantiaca]
MRGAWCDPRLYRMLSASPSPFSVILTKVRIQSYRAQRLVLWILTFVRMTEADVVDGGVRGRRGGRVTQGGGRTKVRPPSWSSVRQRQVSA